MEVFRDHAAHWVGAGSTTTLMLRGLLPSLSTTPPHPTPTLVWVQGHTLNWPFADDMIGNLENPQKSTLKLLRPKKYLGKLQLQAETALTTLATIST